MRVGSSGVPFWTADTVTASSYLSSKIRKQAILDKNSGNSELSYSFPAITTGVFIVLTVPPLSSIASITKI